VLQMLGHVVVRKDGDRKVFLYSLWCHASGAFRGVSLADIQRNWAAHL
jgi:hypothetical protein